jgi:hypothetical protein
MMFRKLIVLGICASALVGCGDPDSSTDSSYQAEEYPRQENQASASPEPAPQTVEPIGGRCGLYGDTHNSSC